MRSSTLRASGRASVRAAISAARSSGRDLTALSWNFRANSSSDRGGRFPDALRATDLGDHSYFAYLTVDCLDDYHARAISEEAEILKPPTNEPWGRREMALRTSEGFRLMLSERTGTDRAESST